MPTFFRGSSRVVLVVICGVVLPWCSWWSCASEVAATGSSSRNTDGDEQALQEVEQLSRDDAAVAKPKGDDLNLETENVRRVAGNGNLRGRAASSATTASAIEIQTQAEVVAAATVAPPGPGAVSNSRQPLQKRSDNGQGGEVGHDHDDRLALQRVSQFRRRVAIHLR